MQAELEALDAALGNPVASRGRDRRRRQGLHQARPDRQPVAKVDVLVIGGAMANTFLAAQGHAMGKSLQEAEMHDTARDMLARREGAHCEILLPVDLVVAAEFEAGCADPHRGDRRGAGRHDGAGCRAGHGGGDEARLRRRSTLVWNGPLGAFETPPFDTATVAIARSVAAVTSRAGWQRRRRRRHGLRAEACRGGGADDLCLGGRRRLPGMAGRQDAAGGRRAGGVSGGRPPLDADASSNYPTSPPSK